MTCSKPESGVVSPAVDMEIPAMASAAAAQDVVSRGSGEPENPSAASRIPAAKGSMRRKADSS